MIKRVPCCPEYFGGKEGGQSNTGDLWTLSRHWRNRIGDHDTWTNDGAGGLLLAKMTDDEIGKNVLWNIFAGKGGIQTTMSESTAVISKVESRDRYVRGSFVIPRDINHHFSSCLLHLYLGSCRHGKKCLVVFLFFGGVFSGELGRSARTGIGMVVFEPRDALSRIWMGPTHNPYHHLRRKC